MAITNARSIKGEMSVAEFKEWMKQFDKDGDGRISRDELRSAIRSKGKRFSGWRSSRALRQADANRNGAVDEGEIENLVLFAKNTLGMKISMY